MWFGPGGKVFLKVIDSWVSCPMVFQNLITFYHHNGWKLTWNLSFEEIDEPTFVFCATKEFQPKCEHNFLVLSIHETIPMILMNVNSTTLRMEWSISKVQLRICKQVIMILVKKKSLNYSFHLYYNLLIML
jgi:hypothetical protein